MSANGILVTLQEPVQTGTRIEIYMDWPGAYFDRLMVRLHLTATVVRVDARGTALRILKHRFLDIKPQAKPAGRAKPAVAARYVRYTPIGASPSRRAPELVEQLAGQAK